MVCTVIAALPEVEMCKALWAVPRTCYHGIQERTFWAMGSACQLGMERMKGVWIYLLQSPGCEDPDMRLVKLLMQ